MATLHILCGTLLFHKSIEVRPTVSPWWVGRRVRLDVDVAVPPDELAAAYGRARRAGLTGRPRSLSEKHLQLAIFVLSRPQRGDPWSARMADWNKQSSGKSVYRNVRNFQRDASQAIQRLQAPNYRWEAP